MLETPNILLQDNMIGGADEAGRGPVFGPIVLAGIAADEEKLLNARDSKKCTRKRRDALYKEISRVAERIEIIKIMPEEIDGMRANGKNLNAIELEAFCSIIEGLGCDEIYIDSLGPGFEHKIKGAFPYLKIIAEPKADDRYKIVSAASIIAKVERDREMDKIAEELKELTGLSVGSGYASDEKTKVFLQRWFESSNSYPPHIRKSWLPARRYLNGNLRGY